MRFTTFLVLAIATLAACISFSAAESAPLVDQGRNLRAQQAGLAAKADDIVASITKPDEIAGNFLEVLRKKAMLTKADKMEEAGKMAKAGILREWAGPISRLNNAQKEKLATMVAEVAKKDPKKWSKKRKFLMAALIAAVGGGLIYAAKSK